MADDPLAQLMSAWKQATDNYLAAWNSSVERWTKSAAGQATSDEVSKTALGAQSAASEVSRQAFEPLLTLAGAVPLSEFRRLMDMVYALHLRMDQVDDQLRELTETRRRRKKAAEKRKAKAGS